MSIAFSEIEQAELVHAPEAEQVTTGAAVLARVGTLVALITAPFAFGAVTVTSTVLLIAAGWLLLLVWLADAVSTEALPFSTYPVMLPALALLAFTAVHWATGISANPLATQLEWLRWVGYLSLALVAGESFVTPRRLRGLCAALALAGVAMAVFGIAQYLTSDGKIYWLIQPSQGGHIFGPYVNRNHFAGLMELWIPLALGLALIPENTTARRWAWCAAALVMAAAVALSGSRGGVIAVGVEVMVLAAAVAALRGGRRALAIALVALLLTGAIVWALDRTQVLERYTLSASSQYLQEEAARYRLVAWRDSLQILRSHWLVGTGLDTFEVQFPAVRSFAGDKVWTHAHNEFLQFAIETGVLGLLLGLWLVVAALRGAWRNLQRTEGTMTGALLIGMACGCLGFMVHGWLDFNFHVPANAANFAVLGALLARAGWEED